ncbi:MAG TPA: TIGR03621 family F420-dependent LLM class oxidoreductase [Candidatus Eisenbacteria bacterium]|nr:TIGR03621 family F420-dependent LLM class oxidoreductase [Candidatus Eisenbacteria bacterium]
MTSRRRFRFMAGAGRPADRRELVERARRAEALGYDVFVVADHLPHLAPLPALVAVAEATERLRIGTFVLNNDLRHPAVLAQELATVDVLSGGRLEIGLGAGWNRAEYVQSGIAFDTPARRIGRLEEAIRVLEGLFADGPFSFEGEHYRISDMDGSPKPVQRPHPPFMIGGGGRRVLTIAGRLAQIVSLAPRLPSPERPDIRGCLAEGTAEKIGWVRAAADGRFDDIEICTYPPLLPITVTGDRRARARELADQLRRGFQVDLTEDEVLDSPHVFLGTVDDLVEKCLALRDRFGISNVMVRTEIEEFAPVVERLAGR